jgi:hypothetical protein
LGSKKSHADSFKQQDPDNVSEKSGKNDLMLGSSISQAKTVLEV